jgi:hypothetical protein
MDIRDLLHSGNAQNDIFESDDEKVFNYMNYDFNKQVFTYIIKNIRKIETNNFISNLVLKENELNGEQSPNHFLDFLSKFLGNLEVHNMDIDLNKIQDNKIFSDSEIQFYRNDFRNFLNENDTKKLIINEIEKSIKNDIMKKISELYVKRISTKSKSENYNFSNGETILNETKSNNISNGCGGEDSGISRSSYKTRNGKYEKHKLKKLVTECSHTDKKHYAKVRINI